MVALLMPATSPSVCSSHFGLEALALAVAQVLAQQHRGPVARFGAAGAGLNIEEAVVRVGRIREHAAEFHVFDALFEAGRIAFAGEEGFLVIFFVRHVEQVLRVAQVVVERGERVDDVVQQLLFPAEGLGMLRVVPDGRVFEFPVDFD
jgi:hypothetical protein